MDEELGAGGGAGGMDEELGGREEVLVAWMKSWAAGGGADGMDEELGAGGGAGGMDEDLGGGRRCCWHG